MIRPVRRGGIEPPVTTLRYEVCCRLEYPAMYSKRTSQTYPSHLMAWGARSSFFASSRMSCSGRRGVVVSLIVFDLQ